MTTQDLFEVEGYDKPFLYVVVCISFEHLLR